MNQAKARAETSRRNGEDERKLWRKVWSMDIKKKIHIFLWKACHDRIPVGVNLKKRGMKVDDRCRICGEEAESIEHMFFHCRKSKIIWELSPVKWDGMQAGTGSFKQWWEEHNKAKAAEELQAR